MGDDRDRAWGTLTPFVVLATALLFLLLAPPALAGPPFHVRDNAADVTGLEGACGAAVDSKGDLYASSSGEGKVKVFDPTHTLLTEISNANVPCALAVNSKGEIFVSEKATGEVIRYKPSKYPFEGTPAYGPREVIDASGEAKGIYVDHVNLAEESNNDRLYVAEGNHVAVYKTDGTLEANILEGKVGDITGVAAYTYTYASSLKRLNLFVADVEGEDVEVFSGKEPATLKLRKTISGVDQDDDPETPDQEFGFGVAGSYLGADPGNETKLKTLGGPRKCEQVQVEGKNQACTAGHFFLYDAGHKVIDEFDASGEYLDQLTTASIADGEPTQIAVDRSGGAGDGTLYASSGAGSGAKLVAFRPLTFPERAAVPELSHALEGALSVSVDDHGNVYVAATTAVHVFDSEGNKITSFEDSEKAYDLSVDSKGNVYVLDGSTNEGALTYYSPSKYPPDGTTTYTRHEPELIPSEILEGAGMQGVAVNPVNDHVFVAGDSSFAAPVIEFGSVTEGSPQLAECGTGLGLSTLRQDIDVYGTNGYIYVTANPGQLYEIHNCGAGKELVREIQGGGCPRGAFVGNQRIAVDQSNGHALVFQSGEAAREYDAAGACVAEFGTFSFNSGGYRVAIDNSCALHEPPLTESTTPTCKSFNPANGTVYAAFDAENNEVQPYDVSAFGPLEYGEPPKPETGLADGLGVGVATLHGTVDPRGSGLEAVGGCRFEYLTDAAYEQNLAEEKPPFEGALSKACAESAAEIGKGLEPVAVHADLTGVEPVTTRYRFRLLAANPFGEGSGNPGLFGPPKATTESVLPVAYDEATLRAKADPSGLASSYRFEYLTEAEYQSNGESFAGAQNTPEGQIPPGDNEVPVAAPVTGLAEGTEYRFRAVVENEVASTPGKALSFETLERAPPQIGCPNAEYRTGFATFLPDCRAYELVTPAETRGLPTVAQTSASGQPYANSWFVAPRGPGAGESAAYIATLPGFDGAGRGEPFRAQRGAGAHPAEGWSSELTGFSFAQSGGSGEQGIGVSPDQRYWLFELLAHETPSEGQFPLGSYLRVPPGSADPACSPDPALAFEAVGCAEPKADLKAQGRFLSAGGTHVVFSSKAHLAEAAAPEGTEAIYDRKAGGSGLEVVSVRPDGTTFGNGENATYVAAAEDGAAVVFRVPNGTLYVHRVGQTTEIAVGANAYAGISANGSHVFYLDKQVNSEPSIPIPTAGLYACDVDAGPCTGPEAQKPTQIAEDALFVNVSPDGLHAFFTSEENLSGTETNGNGETAEASAHNLYACNVEAGPCAGSGAQTPRFVAILDQADFEGFQDGETFEAQETIDQWPRAIPGQIHQATGMGREFSPTRSTPDGGVLVFQSHAKLTAYDNEGRGEIYRYEPGAAAGQQLLCVSCDPSGASPSADALLQTFQPRGATNPDTLVSNVTDDGKRVFFQSRDQLLPEDANEATDVYEWKATGTVGPGGDECGRPGGCLALISTGQGEEPSHLFGMSADGHDVLIATQERLVGADAVGSPSLYDARVEGGIPDPPVPAPCQGDACQPLEYSPPALSTPMTGGAGEGPAVQKKPCAKGKRRVKGRCVSKHKRRKHHGRHRRAGHKRGGSR